MAGEGPKNKIVRGADGGLYFVGEGGEPRKLTPSEAEKLTKILQDAEKNLADSVKKEIPSIADPGIFIVLSEDE
jgi:hypothetical protein